MEHDVMLFMNQVRALRHARQNCITLAEAARLIAAYGVERCTWAVVKMYLDGGTLEGWLCPHPLDDEREAA